MDYILYFHNDNKFVVVDKDLIFDLLYDEYAKIWFTDKEINKFKKQKIILYNLNIQNIEQNKFSFNKTNNFLDKDYFINLPKLAKKISKIDNKVPLYDVYSNNLFLIYKDNVYQRVVYNYYRFPDAFFYDTIKKKNNKKVINFLKNFDLKTLENTYTNVFYYYSNKVGKNLTLCLRPSFLSHLTYINPYYTRAEIINMALNMELIKPNNVYYTREKIQDLCEKIKKNDINKYVILNHQKYIVDSNGVHVVIYYSLNGAYFMNKYLRNKDKLYNPLIEKSILNLWNLIKSAPAFDKNYKLYRFVKSDEHLNHLKVSDIHVEKSFISTTRNPFYNSDTYKFGFILILIRIPTNVIGTALCMETFSNFKSEEEIIFAPLTHLKLISKNKNSNYFHIDSEFSKNVVTKYEFEYVKSGNVKILKNNDPISDNPNNIFIDLETINRLEYNDFISKTEHFVDNYSNQNYQFISKINDINYTFVCEWYDSSSAYEPYFYIKNANGFYIYCQNPKTSNQSLTLEISDYELHVNYYSRYSYDDDYIDITTFDAIKFISLLAYIFGINKIYIHQKYKSCVDFIDISNSQYADLTKRILEMYTYKQDFFNYFTLKKKRFNIDEIVPKFYYYQLDSLFNLSPNSVLNKSDKDELYQLYKILSESSKSSENPSYIDFYLYIIKNRPDLTALLEKKSDKIFRKDNPFILDYYILDGYKFLYNNKLISSMPYVREPLQQDKNIKKFKNKSDYRLENYRLDK